MPVSIDLPTTPDKVIPPSEPEGARQKQKPTEGLPELPDGEKYFPMTGY
jgi:hypothetical protein